MEADKEMLNRLLNEIQDFQRGIMSFRVFKVSISTIVLVGTFFVSFGFYLQSRFEINNFL